MESEINFDMLLILDLIFVLHLFLLIVVTILYSIQLRFIKALVSAGKGIISLAFFLAIIGHVLLGHSFEMLFKRYVTEGLRIFPELYKRIMQETKEEKVKIEIDAPPEVQEIISIENIGIRKIHNNPDRYSVNIKVRNNKKWYFYFDSKSAFIGEIRPLQTKSFSRIIFEVGEEIKITITGGEGQVYRYNVLNSIWLGALNAPIFDLDGVIKFLTKELGEKAMDYVEERPEIVVKALVKKNFLPAQTRLTDFEKVSTAGATAKKVLVFLELSTVPERLSYIDEWIRLVMKKFTFTIKLVVGQENLQNFN
ncbi:MAG: hypothetical protein N2517_08195 [Ignavibacteria bacterium]|nr:hypothetical protein [Ignavibacteria bacterium]